MTQTQLLHEFSQLSLAQQIDLLQSAFEIVSAKVRIATEGDENKESKLSLAEAAMLLRADYEEDEELTIFSHCRLGKGLYHEKTNQRRR